MTDKTFDLSTIMRVFSILFAASLALSLFACQTEVGLDEHRFQCQTDSDCLDGYVCGQAENVCQPVSSAEDAGDVPADTGVDADPGQPDADPDADASPGADGGLECSEEEVPADPFGEGEKCYSTCSTYEECVGETMCIQMEDDSGVCVVPPSGGGTCADILSCQQECQPNDQACLQDCFFIGDPDAQSVAVELAACSNEYCGEDSGFECVRRNCSTVLRTCVGCQEDQIMVGLQCLTACEVHDECDPGQKCVEPYFKLTEGQKVCSYHPDNLNGPCSENEECGGPEPGVTDEGTGVCAIDAPTPQCFAVGCDPSNKYGPSTGCGLDAVCFENSGTPACVALCREQTDCPSSSSCQILQDLDGNRVGLCKPTCMTGDDCQYNNYEGEVEQGRCNDLGYCEAPCDNEEACTTQGGACEGGFCVFDEAT